MTPTPYHAPPRPASRPRSARPLTGWLSAVLLLAVAGCGGEDANGSPPAQSDASAEAEHQVVDVSALGFDEGNIDRAVLQVIEFSDFGCGYCRRFHEETYPALHEEFVETGLVVWKYIPFSMGTFPNSPEVTLAAECVGAQGRFAEMRDILFRQQGEWTRTSDIVSLLAGYANEAGADVEEFGACLAENRRGERFATSNRAAQQLGVRGTPTFFVAGQPVQGAIPLDVFQEVLRDQIAQRSGPRRPGATPPDAPR